MRFLPKSASAFSALAIPRANSFASTSKVWPEGQVSFLDNHPRLGRVSFEGRLDMAGLRAAKGEDSPDNPPVLRGRLVIGARVFENVDFTWFGGD